MVLFCCKNSFFLFFHEKKKEVSIFPGNNPEFQEKDWKMFQIIRKLAGTPYCT
jgi:hypothetical protein